MITTYLSNPDLKTILTKDKWKGTPVDAAGGFVNHEYPFTPKFSEVWKWQTTKNPQKAEKKKDTWRLHPASDTDWLTSDRDCIVWLGHCTFLSV